MAALGTTDVVVAGANVASLRGGMTSPGRGLRRGRPRVRPVDVDAFLDAGSVVSNFFALGDPDDIIGIPNGNNGIPGAGAAAVLLAAAAVDFLEGDAPLTSSELARLRFFFDALEGEDDDAGWDEDDVGGCRIEAGQSGSPAANPDEDDEAVGFFFEGEDLAGEPFAGEPLAGDTLCFFAGRTIL